MSQTPRMIKRRLLFGVREDVKNGIAYLDDRTILWVAGKSLVLYDTELSTQQIFSCSPGCESISALAVSFTRHLLAVAERGANDVARIVIYLYDLAAAPPLKRRKIMQYADLGASEYVSLCFSRDGKHLVSLGGLPEWNVVLWNVEKMRMLASHPALDSGVTVDDMHFLRQCSISPHDDSIICVTGKGHVKFFSSKNSSAIADHNNANCSNNSTNKNSNASSSATATTTTAANPISSSRSHIHPIVTNEARNDSLNYLAHAWSPTEPGHLIVSTDNGDLLLFDNQVYRFPLPVSPSDGLAITSLLAHSKGFVCGGDMGLIGIFERTEGTEMYRKVRTFRFTDNYGSSSSSYDGGDDAIEMFGRTIMQAHQEQQTQLQHNNMSSAYTPTILAFTATPPPTEEYVAFLTSTKQLYALNLPNADFTKAEDTVFRPVCQPFHAGSIIGISVCAQRPLIATAGRDRCLFLWNSTSYTVEVRKRFNTDITSVALHPSGLHLLVGLTDVIKLMSVHDKKLSEFKSFPIRSCTACCFSRGGQFFAIMHSTTIHVYYTYTTELLGHLRGHTSRVRSLHFSAQDDTKLLSTGNDGSVYEFSLTDFHKVGSSVHQSVMLNSAVADVHTAWAAGNDHRLRQLQRPKLLPIAEYDLVDCSITALAISKGLKLLVGGCDDGSVRIFNTYLGEKMYAHAKDADSSSTNYTSASAAAASAVVVGQSILIESHAIHIGAVTGVIFSYDESLLISCGEDGMLIIWDVVAPHRSSVASATAAGEMEYSTELLLDRRDIENTVKLMASLRSQIRHIRTRMQQQQSSAERVHEEAMVQLEKEFNDRMALQRAQTASLQSEMNEEAIRLSEYVAELEKNHHEITTQTQADYDAKCAALRDRIEQLETTMEEEQVHHEAEMTRLRTQVAAQEAAEASAHANAIRMLEADHAAWMTQKAQLEEQTDRLNELTEEENDKALAAQRERVERQRLAQQESLSELQRVIEAMQARQGLSQAELQIAEAAVLDQLRRQDIQEQHIHATESQVAVLQKECHEHEITVVGKERHVHELQRQNAELEKLRFGLECKIGELRAQIEPRDAEIALAQEELASILAEADQYERQNDNLTRQIRSLKQKRQTQLHEFRALQANTRAAEEFQSRLFAEIDTLYRERDNPRELKVLARSMYEKYTHEWSVADELAVAAAATLRSTTNTPKHAAKSAASATALRRTSWAKTTPTQRRILTARRIHNKGSGNNNEYNTTKRTSIDEVREYNRERDHLDHNLASLRRKVIRDAENNRAERNRIMAENVILVQDINDLRKDARVLAARSGVLRQSDPSVVSVYEEETARECLVQRAEMSRLAELIASLEEELESYGLTLPNVS